MASETVVVAAKRLQIEHINKPQYWRWSPSGEAQLIQVWFLHIAADKAILEQLSLETNYAAYFVYKLEPNSQGFNTNAVEFIVGSSYKSCYLDLQTADALQKQGVIGEGDVPKRRSDEWLEIEMGRFHSVDSSNAEVDLIVQDHDTTVAKTGLCVRGVELRRTD